MENFVVKNAKDLVNMPDHIVDKFWRDKSESLHREVESKTESGTLDPTLRALSELIDLSIELGQYIRPEDQFKKSTCVMKVRLNLPKNMIEKCFDIKTVSFYGVGLFAPVEGLLCDSTFRRDSNYDESRSGRKHAPYFDLSSVPQELQDEYEFRIAVPAMGGLFVPKKCDMTSYISTTRQLEFFDLTMFE